MRGAVLVVVVLGCGTKAAVPAGAGGCDQREKEHLCSEWHGTAKPQWVEQQCRVMRVPYVTACPADNAIARCVIDVGQITESHTVWYAPVSREAAQAMCAPPAQLR